MKDISSELLKRKYFIFDIDGTLLDSMPMWTYVDQVVLGDFGIIVNAEELKAFRDSVVYNKQNIHGDIYGTYYEELIKLFELNITADEFQEKRKHIANYIAVYELAYKKGADVLLKKLKNIGKKIGIVSTTTNDQYSIYENESINIKKNAPLKKLVDKKVLCDDVTRKKPDPEAYLKIISMFDCKPEECIVFEDSLNGVIAAKDAGLDVVAIYDDSAKYEQEIIHKIADYKIDNFNDFIKQTGLDKSQSQPE